MKNNNKQKNYIILKYTPNNYQIFIISDTQKIKLKSEDAKIMHRILNNFKNIQTDDNTYIFPDVYLILLAFKKEKNKRNKKYINRKKSRNITLCLVLTASLATGGVFVYNHSKNKELSQNNTGIEEEIDIDLIISNKDNLSDNFDKLKITNDNQTIEIKNPTIINEDSTIKKEETGNISYKNNITAELNYYDDKIGDQKALENASRYDEIFFKAENKYGIDANLLKAISAQESSGRQDLTNGYAYGIMGIEYIWADQTIVAYNFETKQYEKRIIDFKKIKTNIEYCIETRAMMTQQACYTVIKSGLIPNNEILSYTLQRENMGATRMQNILATGEHWMEGRKKVDRGDKMYFENVLSRLPNGTTIKIRMPDGTYFSTIITNLALENTYSKN